MKKLLLLIFAPIFIIAFLLFNNKLVEINTPQLADLDSILSRGKLVVAINNNSTDYFLYKSEPKGFQFELMQDLGNALGVKIEIIVNDDNSKSLEMLKNGECDLVASSWNAVLSNTDVLHSLPILESKLVLVQRKPSDLLVNTGKPDDVLIKNLQELSGKPIYVPMLSGEAHSIKQLYQYNQGKLNVYEIPEQTQEHLIQSVAKGEIDYTVCNTIIANSLEKIYPELDFETVIKTNEPIVWNFRKGTSKLANWVNRWIIDYKQGSRLAILTDKYFNNRNNWFPSESKYNSTSTGQLSVYDEFIKKQSESINWDWRLLASLIYQESRFKPNVRSKRGAYGLMQMMPTTGSYFGVDTSASPEQQIKAGVKYIKFLDNIFAEIVTDPVERINFILASYNIGPGHIMDAQVIARKVGKDPKKWFNSVDSCLLSKSNIKFYSDPEIQHGYCKGTETYNFVSEVLNRFQHFKNTIK